MWKTVANFSLFLFLKRNRVLADFEEVGNWRDAGVSSIPKFIPIDSNRCSYNLRFSWLFFFFWSLFWFFWIMVLQKSMLPLLSYDMKPRKAKNILVTCSRDCQTFREVASVFWVKLERVIKLFMTGAEKTDRN